MNRIINAEFVSEWDGGVRALSSCKVNLDTKEVFDIEMCDNVDADSLEVLDREFIIIDGEEYQVFQACDADKDNEYWYE